MSQILTILVWSASVTIIARTTKHSIDQETTVTVLARKHDGILLDLVMSDEFNAEGRSFANGDDSIFEAISKPDFTNDALQFCISILMPSIVFF